MIIIGSGLIASYFSKCNLNGNYIVFASGVSNSVNPKQSDFDREIKLLTELSCNKLYLNFCLIYFSSCGVVAEKGEYYLHKLNMENLVKEKFDSYLILRLPQLIGQSSNPNTLINNFKLAITHDKLITIQKNAFRYFLEISDLVLVVNYFLSDKFFYNNTYNVAVPVKYSILEIVKTLELILNKKAKYKLINGGINYDLDLQQIIHLFSISNIYYNRNYLFESLVKNN